MIILIYHPAVEHVEETTHKEEEDEEKIQDSEEDKEISEEQEEGQTVWLSPISHITYLGASVDISLGKLSHKEECSIRTPDDITVPLDLIDTITGVVAHGSSHFVSCRVTVGPVTNSSIGDWVLCGEYIEEGVEHKRCQRVTISWCEYQCSTIELFFRLDISMLSEGILAHEPVSHLICK